MELSLSPVMSSYPYPRGVKVHVEDLLVVNVVVGGAGELHGQVDHVVVGLHHRRVRTVNSSELYPARGVQSHRLGLVMNKATPVATLAYINV